MAPRPNREYDNHVGFVLRGMTSKSDTVDHRIQVRPEASQDSERPPEGPRNG